MYKKLQNNSKEVSDVMKILANENRLSILCYIWKRDKWVWRISEDLGLSQSLVSQILNRLKAEGILDSKRNGKEVFYEIKDKKIFKIIESLKNIYS